MLKAFRLQIALEFFIISMVALTLFAIIFLLISAQDSSIVANRDLKLLQSYVNIIASYIDIAAVSNSNINIQMPLYVIDGHKPIIALTKNGFIEGIINIGNNQITAYSDAPVRGIIINSTEELSNGLYIINASSGFIRIEKHFGVLYINNLQLQYNSYSSSSAVPYINYAIRLANISNNGYIEEPLSSITNQTTEFSITFWVLQSPDNNGPLITISNSSSCVANDPQQCQTLVILKGNNLYLTFGDLSYQYTINEPYGSLSNIGIVYNNGILDLYFNGKLIAQRIVAGFRLPKGNQLYLLTYNASSNYNGNIADIQIYNIPLPGNSISLLYNNGPSFNPFYEQFSSNLVDWFNLDGNLLNYISGSAGTGSSLSYITFAKIEVIRYSSNNSLFTDYGVIGNGTFNYSSSKNLSVIAGVNQYNLSITGGNLSYERLVLNAFPYESLYDYLAGWYPLDEGYGSIVYDLRAGYVNGSFTDPIWSNLPTDTSPILAADFKGSNYIDTGYNIINLFNNKFNSNYFTINLWINIPKGALSNKYICNVYSEPILSAGSTNQFVIYAYSTSLANNTYGIIYGYVPNNGNRYILASTPQIYSYNRWYMITYYINKSFQSLYVDGSLSNITNICNSIGRDVSSLVGTHIAGDIVVGADQLNGEYMKGYITNLQIYNVSLNSLQVNNLYNNPLDAPLSYGAVAWYLLDGNASDYFNPRTVVTSNVNFSYIQSPSRYTDVLAPVFNSNNYITIPAEGMLTDIHNAYTVSFDIYPFGCSSECQIIDLPGMFTAYWNNGSIALNINGKALNIYYNGLKMNTRDLYNIIVVNSGSVCLIYINGLLQNQTSCSSSGLINNIIVGRGFNGSISNLQLYYAALNQSAVSQIASDPIPQVYYYNGDVD
ncbi:MAG: hypothetical protein ARM1_0846 [Candidatus Micrarchaeota archaeon]|nr:MAG: hypothetical protein ARM1_0846 [Candidatus Micrarchaeota archaeon]